MPAVLLAYLPRDPAIAILGASRLGNLMIPGVHEKVADP
jgi:hypothetical protein